MPIKHLALALTVSAIAFHGSQAQQVPTLPETVDGPIGRMMHEYLTRAAQLGFSGQVLAAKDGKILLHQAYGFSDRRHEIPITTSTSVGVASMSKQFTAAAILKLATDGKLRLSDTLGAFFKGLPADKSGITIQQIVTHTSGIRGGVTEDFDVGSLDSSMTRLMSLPLTGKPGEKWRYSSDAYGILAAIVQNVSGMPFERYMHETILGPAGMSHSGFWHEARDMGSVAHAYAGLRHSGTPAMWPRDWRVFGSGDLMTTASDLYRWDRALRAGRIFAGAALTQYSSGIVPIGSGSDMYGYGLFVTTTPRKTKLVEHGGDTELGFNGAFFRYLDEDAVLIITSNARDVNFRSLRQYVQGELDRMLFGADTIKPPLALQRPSRPIQAGMTGSYQIDSTSAFHIMSDGAYLWIGADGQSAVDVLRAHSADVSPEMFANANRRTATLIDALMRFDTTAYVVALGDSGAAELPDYREEWKALLEQMGPIRGYRVLGSMRQGGSLVTTVSLSFLRGDKPMSFMWSALGRGRLVGSNVLSPSPYPVVLPLGVDSEGKLVAYDLWRVQTRATFSPLKDGRLGVLSAGIPNAASITTQRRSLAEWMH